jgi:hypothetical protein
MGSLAITAVAFGCCCAAMFLGMFLHRRLPAEHTDAESRDVVKQAMALVATMAALVLGLMVASASTSHQGQANELTSLSADILLLDQTLALYGPDAQSVRDGLREEAQETHDAIWSSAGVHTENLNSAAVRDAVRAMHRQLAALDPKTDLQQQLKIRAFTLSDSIGKSRISMFESTTGVQWPLLTVLIFWISTLFLGFGVLTRVNMTVSVSLVLAALSVSAAIFLILELSEPYRGILQVSDAPLRRAIAQMDR